MFSSSQCPNSSLYTAYKIIIFRIYFIIFIVNLKFYLLSCLKNIINQKRFFKIGIEIIGDSLSSTQKNPGLIRALFFIIFDKNIDIRIWFWKDIHIKQPSCRYKNLKLYKFFICQVFFVLVLHIVRYVMISIKYYNKLLTRGNY